MDIAFLLNKYFKYSKAVSIDAFDDECIAKLLLEIPLNEHKKRTTFRGLNPMAERNVLVALQRRYKVQQESLYCIF